MVTATVVTAADDAASDITPLETIDAIDVAPIGGNPVAPAEIAMRPLTPIAQVQVAPLTPPERRN
jgi:hypothetical protein